MNIQTLIDEGLNQKREEKGKVYEQTSWHPSSLGSCLCGVYLQRIGEEPVEDFDARILRVFEMGNLIEEFVLDQIEAAGHELDRQTRVKDQELDISGKVDGVFKETGYPIEIKSCNSRKFTWMRKQKGPDHHHKMQLWIYLYLLQRDKGTLVYVSKDDLRIGQYDVYLNTPDLKKEVLKELDILKRAWEQKLPPEPRTEGWQAKYCRFHKKCLTQPKYI